MEKKRHRLSVAAAMEIADAADLPDGAWWAMMEELTGLDVGTIAEALADEHDNEPTMDEEE